MNKGYLSDKTMSSNLRYDTPLFPALETFRTQTSWGGAAGCWDRKEL